ncbi:MAG: hypothetical protein ACXADO_03175 [Candidatus Thorarchaeota archaeon]
MSTRSRANWLVVGFFGVMLVMSLSPAMHMHVVAQNSLSLSLDRNFGMGLGGLIQGTFTLRSTAPTSVQNLTVYFNGEQVQIVTGNTINWQFNTGDYPSGATNITLFGLDDGGVTYVGNTQVFFIGGVMSTLITVGIIALVTVLIIVRYGPMLRGRRGRTDRVAFLHRPHDIRSAF